MSLTTTVSINISAALTKTADGRSVSDNVSLPVSFTLADGTGAGKASKRYYKQHTLATGATLDLDLSGTLTDIFGDAIVFTKIRLIAIVPAAANTTNLTIGGDAAALIGYIGDPTDTVKILADGGFVIWNKTAAGYPVTATTADILQIVNSAGADATFTILIVGE